MVQQGIRVKACDVAPLGPKVTSATGTPAARAVRRSVSVSPTSMERATAPPARSTAAT